MTDNDLINDVNARDIVRNVFDTSSNGSASYEIAHQLKTNPILKEYCIDAALAVCELLEKRDLYFGCPATRDTTIEIVAHYGMRRPAIIVAHHSSGSNLSSNCDYLIDMAPSPDDTRKTVASDEKHILRALRSAMWKDDDKAKIDRALSDLDKGAAANKEKSRLERLERREEAGQSTSVRHARKPTRPRSVRAKGPKKAAPAPSEGS